jgi:hypothetical protein
MIYGASDLAWPLLNRTDDQVRDVFLAGSGRDLSRAAGTSDRDAGAALAGRHPVLGPSQHRRQPVLEQPVGSIHLAGDYLGARVGMDTAAVTGDEAANQITGALTQ